MFVTSLLLTLLSVPGPGPADGDAPLLARGMRAIWITRFDYRTRQDVVRAVEQCAEAGFDTLLFQVRGNATVFFRSSYEPWAEQLGWQDPGFDPLAVAIEEAHERGLALHAWVNVVPAWWGPEPPKNERHLYHAKPEWFWYDQRGERQPLSERFYVSLNPCLPEVRAHLVRVLEELVVHYPIDGLHLDYLRFPNEPPGTPEGSGADYPRDERTLALYRRVSEKAPDEDPSGWDDWRTRQVDTLLREIHTMVRRHEPYLPLTAAVGPEPERALEHHQDVRRWIDEGLLDAVFPMNYTASPELFAARVERWKTLGAGQHVVMGLMIGSGDPTARMEQVRTARASFGSFCAFAYSALFDSPNEAIDSQASEARAERRRRREAFVPFFRGLGR